MAALAACFADAPQVKGLDRIVGGVNAEIEAYPHQVTLQDWFGHTCGGSVIDAQWILTAAHCLEEVPPGLEIAAGVTRLREVGYDGQLRRVARVHLHPAYDASTYDHDIALLRLVAPLDLTAPSVSAVPTMTPDNAAMGWTDPGVVATVTGWGDLQTDGPMPDVLQSVEVPIVTLEAASKAYDQEIGEEQIAAGYLDTGGADACQGDSGGPLVVPDDAGQWTLAGVVSWGGDCAAPDQPGMYARVSHFDEWIGTTMKGGGGGTPVPPADGEPVPGGPGGPNDGGGGDCAEGQYICDDGTCIEESWICDGNEDCAAAQDEIGCDCDLSDFVCGDQSCLAAQYVCDGYVDCEDESDEIDCEDEECAADDFVCDGGQCVWWEYVCDDYVDCEDESDEIDCGYEECQADDFTCGDGQCIPWDYTCDDYVDCADGSDEQCD